MPLGSATRVEHLRDQLLNKKNWYMYITQRPGLTV